jgi:hypothetical protein
MKLPINEKELEEIILSLKKTNPTLYSKLWTYKINYLNKEKK